MSPRRFGVYIRRTFNDGELDAFLPGLTVEETQALRFEQHQLPGRLLEFDAIEEPRRPA